MTVATRRYVPEGRLGKLVVRGARLTRDLADRVLDGTLELTRSEVSALKLTIEDAALTVAASKLLARGAAVDYAGLAFRVEQDPDIGDSDGVPVLQVQALDLGAAKLRAARGVLVVRGTTPTQLLRTRARAAGLAFVGQPSAVRKTIARQTGENAESDWDLAQRLASELGHVCYVAAGTMFFGRPTWLLGQLPVRSIDYARAVDRDRLLAFPSCSTSTADGATTRTIGLSVDGAYGETLTPGQAVRFAGIPGYAGTYAVDAVTIPLSDADAVSVTLTTPANPVAEPPEPPAASGKTPGNTATGGPTAAAFVALALAQAGDKYVFGAETSAKDANPNAFDCSELVEWAAARVGVKIVDGSGAQRAACARAGTLISVEKAIGIKGALLFAPGHVAISLGNGRTIEAANRTYGVREMNARGRQTVTFDAGGLIPGMTYPTTAKK